MKQVPILYLSLFLTMWFIFPVMVLANEGTGLTRYAIIVGANNGGKGRIPLLFSHRDAESMLKVMEELGGLKKEDARLLLDPTPEEIEGTFDEIARALHSEKERGRKSHLLFYYSGHSDEQGLLLGGKKFAYAELRKRLDQLDSDVRISIVDSCASGVMTREKGGTWQPPFMIDESSDITGQVILTSSSADESAQESDKVGGSFFTHYIVSGLRGAADMSQDKRVTLNEAYQYAFNETLKRTESTQAGPQHPSYSFKLAGAGDLVLTDLSVSTSLLLIPAETAGRLFLRDAEGRLVAEINKIAGKEIRFGLEPGTYGVLFEQIDGSVLEGTVTVVAERATVFDTAQFHPTDKKAATRKGGEKAKEYKRVMMNFAVIPAWSVNAKESGPVLNNFSFGLLMSGGEALEGVELSLCGSNRSDYMKGLQFSMVWNSVGAMAAGVQFAGFFNGSGPGTFVGLQIAGGVNVHRGDFKGVQFSLVNIATGTMTGIQFSALNIAGGAVSGLQFSTLNIATDIFSGLQFGAANYTHKEFKGLQLGVANYVNDEIHGMQTGALNIVAGTVHGFQFGLVNVAEDSDFSLGLLSIMTKGRTTISLLGDDEGGIIAELKHGGSRWHAIYGMGVIPRKYPIARMEVGIGAHIPAGERFFFDIDFLADVFVDKDGFEERTYDSRQRLLAGVHITKWLAITLAFTNTFLVFEKDSLVDSLFMPNTNIWTWKKNDGTPTWSVQYRPGIQLGLQFL